MGTYEHQGCSPCTRWDDPPNTNKAGKPKQWGNDVATELLPLHTEKQRRHQEEQVCAWLVS